MDNEKFIKRLPESVSHVRQYALLLQIGSQSSTFDSFVPPPRSLSSMFPESSKTGSGSIPSAEGTSQDSANSRVNDEDKTTSKSTIEGEMSF